MKAVHVPRKRVAVCHVTHAQRERFKVLVQVLAAVFAGKHVLQADDKVSVLNLLFMGWMRWVVETHRM
jgi:hypothetical protein